MLRRVGVLAAALGLVTLGLLAANAQDYPSRSIRLLIHTPPGSLVDVLGRLVGQELSQRLGQSIVADNRTGGATMIAVDQLLHSPPDGYTLMITSPEATMQPFLKKSYRYDPIKDFTPVALIVTSWTVFAVNPKVPANTLSELVVYSRAIRCVMARAAPVACCILRARCSSSRAAEISFTCPIVAARRPRPTRSRVRSRWFRWALPRRALPRAGN
jgi:tripartite-type tricarboxylate transporter receptor subunit TctC